MLGAPRRFGADEPGTRILTRQPGHRSGQQSPAADRKHEHVGHVAELSGELGDHRALAGNRARIVERGDEHGVGRRRHSATASRLASS